MDEENTDKNEKTIAQKFFDWWHNAYKESKESLAAQWNNGAKA